MDTLQGKRIIIIGGSSGIGLRTAELAAQEGANLVLCGRHTDRLEAAKTKLEAFGTSIETHLLDAHHENSLTQFFNRVAPFDHLISMVGDVMGGGFLSADIATIRHVIESKFLANVRIGQLAASKINKGGSLVFTSGTGGRAQDACASYVGNLSINALVEGLAVEMAAQKVRVNAVSPTWTLTTFWRDIPQTQVTAIKSHFEEVIPLKRTADIDELSAAYLFLMKNTFITGQHIAVDGGIMLGA